MTTKNRVSRGYVAVATGQPTQVQPDLNGNRAQRRLWRRRYGNPANRTRHDEQNSDHSQEA